MSEVLIIGLVAGLVLLGWAMLARTVTPADREIARVLQEQAAKRNGTFDLARGRGLLTVPYKTTTIETSTAEMFSGDVGTFDYVYARFRTSAFRDKDFKLINKSDGLLKPFFLKTDLSDERLSENYFAAGSDGAFLNELLTPDIRDALLKTLLNVQFGTRVGRGVGERGWLTVFKWHIVTPSGCDQLMETAALFHDRFEKLAGRGARSLVSPSPQS